MVSGVPISPRCDSFRRTTVVGVVGLLLWTHGATAQEIRSPDVPAAESPSLSALAPRPRIEPDASGYRIAAIAAVTVVGVIAANFVSRGLLTPILAIGTGTSMATPTLAMPSVSQLGYVVVVIAAHVTGLAPEVLFVAAVPALASVSGPVDAALRDGYTNPSTLLAAFEESASRAGSVVTAAGSYVGSAVTNWLNGP